MVACVTMQPMVGCVTMPKSIQAYVILLIIGLGMTQVMSSGESKRLDPASWGSDHVGKPIPEYVTGDECLFCHRKIGPAWQENRHHLTIRLLEESSPAQKKLKPDQIKEVKYVMGSEEFYQFLKPAKDYGKLALLKNVTDNPHWDTKTFGQSCAGCHATAVDSKTQSFSSLSLDCYACHGHVNLQHSKKPELVHLSNKRHDSPQVVTSICAQCHIRTGTSKSSGLPYPNNFIAGDNLFKDFKVNFTDEDINKLSTMDRHILNNVRDVVIFGKNKVTCLSCHDVHGQSSKKHHRLEQNDYCLTCHHAEGPKRKLKPLTAHSQTCGIGEKKEP